MKEQFLELLKKSKKREGINELIQFFRKIRFFLLHQQVQDFMEITKVVL